jgi:membrane associated rhomboid family serine protease
MELKKNISVYISGLSIVEKIILLNIFIYLFPFLIKTILFLFNVKGLTFINWFTIDADISEFILKPWSLLTYGFIHGGFSHIF